MPRAARRSSPPCSAVCPRPRPRPRPRRCSLQLPLALPATAPRLIQTGVPAPEPHRAAAAAAAGRAKLVTLLLARAPELAGAADLKGRVPLHAAAEHGQIEACPPPPARARPPVMPRCVFRWRLKSVEREGPMLAPPPRTNWTRLVPPSVLTGQVSSLLGFPPGAHARVRRGSAQAALAVLAAPGGAATAAAVDAKRRTPLHLALARVAAALSVGASERPAVRLAEALARAGADLAAPDARGRAPRDMLPRGVDLEMVRAPSSPSRARGARQHRAGGMTCSRPSLRTNRTRLVPPSVRRRQLIANADADAGVGASAGAGAGKAVGAEGAGDAEAARAPSAAAEGAERAASDSGDSNPGEHV
jgi:hypothetical protein